MHSLPHTFMRHEVMSVRDEHQPIACGDAELRDEPDDERDGQRASRNVDSGDDDNTEKDEAARCFRSAFELTAVLDVITGRRFTDSETRSRISSTTLDRSRPATFDITTTFRSTFSRLIVFGPRS